MHLSLNNSLGKWILPAPFSPEATNYFSRLDAAGDTTYVDYKQPLANYIDSLVTLGGAYWDDMGSAASFVGVGIQGVTVPLKSTMTALTNNNFVAGDLNQLIGLKGDGSLGNIHLPKLLFRLRCILVLVRCYNTRSYCYFAECPIKDCSSSKGWSN